MQRDFELVNMALQCIHVQRGLIRYFSLHLVFAQLSIKVFSLRREGNKMHIAYLDVHT